MVCYLSQVSWYALENGRQLGMFSYVVTICKKYNVSFFIWTCQQLCIISAASIHHSPRFILGSPPPLLPSSWKTPPVTSLKEVKTAPSCWREVEWGGIEPGVMPPMSAWCPLLATKNTGLLTPCLNTWGKKRKKGGNKASEVKMRRMGEVCIKKKRLMPLTGVMTVRSGRWLPPAHGWLLRITSPSFSLFPSDLICTEKKKQHHWCQNRVLILVILVSAGTYSSPGTGRSLAWPPGAQGCGVHWTLNHHLVQTQHRRSRDVPWCWWRWRFFGELYPSVL